jgi:hypothetical protein
MTTDMMGAFQRAWMCAGFGWFADVAIPERVLDLAGDRPVLCLPGFYRDDPLRLEEAFGWAMVELHYRRRGWMSIVQRLYQIEDVPSEAA